MKIVHYVQSLLGKVGKFLRILIYLIWMNFKVLILNKGVRAVLIMLRTVWPVILVLVIAYLSLNLMDQMRDLLDTLVQSIIYSCSAFASLLLLSLTTWYTIRILFILKDQRWIVEQKDANSSVLTQSVVDLKNSLAKASIALPAYARINVPLLKQFTRWTPVLLGLIPSISLWTALGKVEHTGIHAIALLVMVLIYVAIVRSPRHYVNKTARSLSNQGNGVTPDDMSITAYPYRDLLPVHQHIIQFLALSMVLLAVLAAIPYTNILLSSTLGPIAVIFLALTMWMAIAGLFTYLDYRFQTPFTLICLVLMVLFNNNNHQIRTVDGTNGNYIGKDPAESVPGYFKNWLSILLNERERAKTDSSKITPVYLISTEGGGIRSAYWTATVLQKLDSVQPNFYRHVFAISGVSGGSVGAAIYTAQHRDHLRNKQFKFDVDAFFSNDFLSPLLTAMLIPDMLQKFSPVGFNQLDRARYLEDSWESAYQDAKSQTFGSDETGTFQPFTTFSKPFLDLWRSNGKGDSVRYKTPILFLNATLAETGRKGVLTPLSISNDPNFRDVIDIQEAVYRHIPLKTAASMSARFPIVTPPATIRVINEPSKDAGNFVDGGYLDNSGTTTLLSILSSLTHDAALIQWLREKNVVLKIITINNSPESDINQRPEALRGTYELRAPLQAFFKSWDNSGDARQYAVREYLRGFSGALTADSSSARLDSFICSKPYNFNLNRKTGIIPLGWDLSESAEKRVREQAKLIPALVRQGQYQAIFEGIN